TAPGAARLRATDGAGVHGCALPMSAAGTVLNAGSNQTLSVTFTPTDGANYTTTTKTVSITVLKGTPTITWPTPADITYGTALSATQLNATVSGALLGSLAYTPAAGAVLNAGSNQTLSVTFTPTDTANVNTATRTITINVLKATPVITWPTPADITFGTALSTTQLNATVSGGVLGTFVYTPAA